MPSTLIHRCCGQRKLRCPGIGTGRVGCIRLREALVNPNKALLREGRSPRIVQTIGKVARSCSPGSNVSHYLADKSALNQFTSRSLLDHLQARCGVLKVRGQDSRGVAGAIVDLSLGKVLGMLQARPVEVRAHEYRAIKVNIVEDRTSQISTLEVGSVQTGIGKVGSREVRGLKVARRKVGRPKKRPLHAG